MKSLINPEKSNRSRSIAQRPTAIRITRRFAAPAADVFDAWLDPEIAGQWLFATASRPMTHVEIDARVEGAFRFAEQRDGDREGDHLGQTARTGGGRCLKRRIERVAHRLSDEVQQPIPAFLSRQLAEIIEPCSVLREIRGLRCRCGFSGQAFDKSLARVQDGLGSPLWWARQRGCDATIRQVADANTSNSAQKAP